MKTPQAIFGALVAALALAAFITFNDNSRPDTQTAPYANEVAEKMHLLTPASAIAHDFALLPKPVHSMSATSIAEESADMPKSVQTVPVRSEAPPAKQAIAVAPPLALPAPRDADPVASATSPSRAEPDVCARNIVPGFLFWVALLYAGLGTLITHLIGRPLIGLYFQRQHMEADFRFSLARLREYTEQVALLNGEDAEQNMVGQRFGALIANYLALVYRRMRVTAFTHTFGQISPIIPYIFTAPFYFARKIELGVMTQTAGAFGHVAGALTFFVNYYTYLAGFKSVVDRLTSFDAAIDQAQALSNAGPKRIASIGGTPRIDLENVDLFLPDGRRTVETKYLVLAEGESVVLSGPSGSGKSTLFRAIAGIWPFGAGGIRSPAGIRIMVVPAKPYIPISTLRAAVTYPGVPGTYSDDDIRRALTDAHLGDLVSELNREEVWSQRLSSGEQQRVALARALLMKPDWLFLDESTSAVDERLEADLYATLVRRLPKTTIMSIGHRSAVVGLHQRHLEMCREGDHFTVRDSAKMVAAE